VRQALAAATATPQSLSLVCYAHISFTCTKEDTPTHLWCDKGSAIGPSGAASRPPRRPHVGQRGADQRQSRLCCPPRYLAGGGSGV
jgi:hypothetical protein